MKVRLYVSDLREDYIHELKATGVRNQQDKPLLHNTAYYTLHQLPAGERLEDHSDHNMIAEAPSANETECGRDDGKRTLTQPSDWDKADITITIGTKPGLQYDLRKL